ncbi:MAG: AzlC family ABC transporter permease [Kiloniellales bacterium]|nr:AzlC family ABC transporter permease [Kiloniellales bacterium]
MEKTRKSEFRAEVGAGVIAITPLVISVAAYGLLWGALSAQKGLSVLEAFLMSAFVFAGGSQFVALEVWSTPVAVWTLGATAFVVNLRLVLMGASLAPHIAGWSPAKTFASLFFMADENWALAMRRATGKGLTPAYYFAMAAMLYPVWVVSTPLGNYLGAGLSDPGRWGLDFAFAAVFLVLVMGFWRSPKKSIPCWSASAAAALIVYHTVEGAWYILAGGLAGTLVGYFQNGERGKEIKV